MGFFFYSTEEREEKKRVKSYEAGHKYYNCFELRHAEGLSGHKYDDNETYKLFIKRRTRSDFMGQQAFDAEREYDKKAFIDGLNAAKQEYTKVRKEELKKYSLTCRLCGGLAYPVMGTSRHYECSCGNKFTGAKHS